MPVRPELLEILVCPESKAPLVWDQETDRLISTDAQTRLAYRIENDIPIMLVDEAQPLSEEEWRAIMAANGREDVIPT